MSGFGEYLRRQRLDKGISLNTIADSTRISVRILDALESEQFDLLPGGVFNLSFVRQYCREVGLDEAEAIERFKQVAGHTTEVAFDHLAVSAQGQSAMGTASARVAEGFAVYSRRYGSRVAGFVAAVALLGGGLYSYNNFDSVTNSASRPAPNAIQESPAPRPVEAARPTFVVDRDPSKPIQLELRMKEEVWVRAHADGERVLEATLKPGDTRRIEATNQVRLRVGNAGGVEVALNGKAMPPIGPRGHVLNAVVTPGGMHVVQPPVNPDEAGGGESGNETQTSRSISVGGGLIASLAP